MSIDYPAERCTVITSDRSLRHERLSPKSSSAEPTDHKGASSNVKGMNIDPPSHLQSDGHNISRRFASGPFSPLSANGADFFE